MICRTVYDDVTTGPKPSETPVRQIAPRLPQFPCPLKRFWAEANKNERMPQKTRQHFY